MFPKRILFFLVFILIQQIQIASLCAQDEQEVHRQQFAFAQAENYLSYFQNDSAIIILGQLIAELTTAESLETKFGISVQLRYAEALEKDHQDELAIKGLKEVVTIAKKKEAWKELGNAYLSLARLYEKIDLAKQCLKHLRIAQSLISNNQLKDIYPRFATRISSYHRFHGQRDSAIYYAKQAVIEGPLVNAVDDTAVGHMLLGLLLSDSLFKDAEFHYSQAAERWKQSGDYSGYGAIMSNLSKLHFRNGQFKSSLLYNDYALLAVPKALEMGNESNWLPQVAYLHRSKIYERLGRLDSALHYQEKGYELKLEDSYKSNQQKIIEIDAKYQNEQKEQTISLQAAEIQRKNERKNQLTFASSYHCFLPEY